MFPASQNFTSSRIHIGKTSSTQKCLVRYDGQVACIGLHRQRDSYHIKSKVDVIGAEAGLPAMGMSIYTSQIRNRLVLGQWHADNRNGRTVLDVLTKAKASSRPDIFGGFHPLEARQAGAAHEDPNTPPLWLTELVDRFKMGPVEVECTAFKVSYNGMEVKVAVNVAAPETSQLAHLGSRAEAFMLLMALEAGTLADRQPKGNQQ